MPGMNGRRQNPCSSCGKTLASDDMYDVIMQKREPREDRRSPRSSVAKYLPPNKTTVCHLYLCNECAAEFMSFLATYEGGI